MQFRPSARVAGVLAVIAPLLLSGAAPASLIKSMDLAELTAGAGRVVLGEVLSVQSQWDAGHRTIFTRVEIQVAETWKGPATPGGRLTVFQPGGSVGDIEMRVHGLRSFQPGERAVLFLSAGDPAYTIGLGQGHRPLRFDEGRRGWVVDPGDRSAAYEPAQKTAGSGSRLVAPDGVVTLEDLRKNVRALVRR
jgi:hypothetical protein